MTTQLNILMVDDHPIILEGYQNVLMATKKPEYEYLIHTANTCDSANQLLQKSVNSHPYDVCFFDISLPVS